ncbi:MAG: hypothetical protein ACOYT9_00965 [Patescibacteria group bacterium]
MKKDIPSGVFMTVLIALAVLCWQIYTLQIELDQKRVAIGYLESELEASKTKQSTPVCSYGRYGMDISQDGSYPENYKTEVYRNIRELKSETGKLLNSFEDYTLRLNSETKSFILDLYERDGMGVILEGTFVEKYTKSEDYITGGYITLNYSTSGYGTKLPASIVFKVASVDPLILELDTDLAPAISYPKKGTQYAFYWKE